MTRSPSSPAAAEDSSSELGIDAQVRFLGRVAEEELPDWYRGADLFVLPTVAYEGFGMVTAEALSCGTPVLGTPVGATPELLGPLGSRYLTSDATAASLARSLEDLLPHLDDDARRSCADYAVKYDWRRVIISWEAALGDAVNS